MTPAWFVLTMSLVMRTSFYSGLRAAFQQNMVTTHGEIPPWNYKGAYLYQNRTKDTSMILFYVDFRDRRHIAHVAYDPESTTYEDWIECRKSVFACHPNVVLSTNVSFSLIEGT